MQTISFPAFKKLYDVNFKAKIGDEDYIGAGGFGIVYKAYDENSHHFVAIKKAAKEIGLLKEVEMASQIPSHPNIAKYLAGFRIDTEADYFDVAILQYYPLGNLSQLISKQTLSFEQIIFILKGILEGLKFLHDGFEVNGSTRQIIHRDLKPRNILITERNGNYIPLITDFGISKLVNKEDIHSTGGVDLSNQLGTISYKAPEQVLGAKSVRSNLDLWAFGVIVFEILKGYTPFAQNEDNSTNKILRNITDQDLSLTFSQIDDIPEVFQQIIKKCLIRDIKVRVQGADELLDILNKSKIDSRLETIPKKSLKIENHVLTDIKIEKAADNEPFKEIHIFSTEPSKNTKAKKEPNTITEDNKNGTRNILIFASFIGIFLIALSFFTNKKTASSTINESLTNPETNISTSNIDSLKILESNNSISENVFTKTLKSGYIIKVSENSLEWFMINFLEDNSKPIDKTTWWNCDNMLFDTGSSTIRQESKIQVTNIKEIMDEYNCNLKIGAYSDNVGNDKSNLKLTNARALAVKNALISLGISPNRLESEGYGNEYPIASNNSEEGRAQNRRIAIRFTSKVGYNL